MTDRDAFFMVHRDLPRQGPGLPEDVIWALDVASVSGAVRVLDAGCGPGADLRTLATALPQARLEGIDKTPHLAAEARANLQDLVDRVAVTEGDMASLVGPYDLIWSAGALYFLGITEGLSAWAPALAPGGAVAFSEPVLLETPASEAAAAFWEEYPQITDLAGIEARVQVAGFTVLDHRMIVGAAWEAYYTPMKARLAMLRAGDPDPVLVEAIEASAREAARWEAAPDQIAYCLLVVRPA